MTVPHTHELEGIELLRSAAGTTGRTRRGAPRRQRARALRREHPQLTIFTVNADEITSQLAHGGRR